MTPYERVKKWRENNPERNAEMNRRNVRNYRIRKSHIMTPSELIARIRVLMNERMQLTQDYQQRFTRVTEEIQAYQRQLHEAQAGADHDMPF